MSLINEALKRAQQSTEANEPPRLEELELRPINPDCTPSSSEGGGARRVIWIVVLLVVTLNIVLWIVFKDRGNETEVAARTVAVEVVEPAPAAPVVPSPGGSSPEVVPEVAPVQIEIETAVSEPVAIDRPEFNLKTIVAHPMHPSAMINNRVLFVGDRVEGYTVGAINNNDVTLILDEDEIVVSLP
jgi:hypothetical protein